MNSWFHQASEIFLLQFRAAAYEMMTGKPAGYDEIEGKNLPNSI
jgi:hypothetical protein